MENSNNKKKRMITIILSVAVILVIAITAVYALQSKPPAQPEPAESNAFLESLEAAESNTFPESLEAAESNTFHESLEAALSESQRSARYLDNEETTASEQEDTSSETSSETHSSAAPETEEHLGPLIVIDPGHQGPNQDMTQSEPIAPGSSVMKARIVTGTYGRTTGLNEYELVLSVSLQLEKELKARGYRVIMTRTDQDINISNIERAQIANENQADAMIRIHANGSDDSSVKGALTMSPSPENPYVPSPEDCLRLSQNIIDSFCAATGLENDGILYTDEMTGINWCEVPVTILEMGFMTNPEDDTYLADAEHYPVMVKGIADGLDQFFSRFLSS